MTFLQLEIFIAVMENDTFFDAAEQLNISQSSLSKQIMSLEKELGVTLLDRSRRSAAPTRAGLLFYEDAVRLMDCYEQMLGHMKPYGDALAGCIRLGTLPILSQYKITPVLQKFCKAYPGIRMQIDEVEDEPLIYGLKHGTYDLIIARDTLLREDAFKSYPLATDRLVALVSSHHPLAGKASIPLKALENENFILMHRQIGVHQLCVDSCRSEGFTPNIVRTARIESILSAVAAGEAVSLLCRKNFTVFNPDGIAVLDTQPQIPTSVALAHLQKTRLSSTVRLFLDYMLKNYENIPGGRGRRHPSKYGPAL